MDELLDFFVNVSLIILILGIYAIYKFRKEKKIYWFILLCVSITLISIAIGMIEYGHGNLYIAIVISVIAIVFLVVMLYISISKKIRGSVTLIMPIPYILCSVYKRMRYEKIISIDEQTDIFAFFSSIIENEYFKGISIGIISAVVAGVILEKIKERK